MAISTNEPLWEASTIGALLDCVRSGQYRPAPDTVQVVSAFWIRQSTQFPGTQQKYRNYYFLVRVGYAFGACCVEHDQFDPAIAEEVSGQPLAVLLEDDCLPVRIAALDAYLSAVLPHASSPHAQRLILPAGSPIERAQARDTIVASMLSITPGQRVGLIGVVNPLVGAIKERGAICLPCDFNMRVTQWGDAVSADMEPVLEAADAVIATGMTLSNGSFDRILERARQRAIPLALYAQTGSAVVPRFLRHGVAAVLAEPFPFSQFSADPTPLYLYRRDESEEV